MRARAATLWLASVILFWTGLAGVSRLPGTRATSVTSLLFALALPFTGVALAAGATSLCVAPRRARLRVAAVTLGVLLAVGIAELSAAIGVVSWEGLFRDTSGRAFYVRDPLLGFRHTPNMRWSGRPPSDVELAWGLPVSAVEPITVTYDARGYRNPVPLDRADVVLIGDSYVEGAYASDDQIASRFLEARLGRPVANLGVAGYGTSQELNVLKRDAAPLAPRTVIWFFYEGNDLHNDHEFEVSMLPARPTPASIGTAWTRLSGWWRRSLLRAAHKELRLRLHPVVPQHYPYFGTLGVGGSRGQRIYFGIEAASPWTVFEQGRWDVARETLRAAARFTRDHGIRLLLVFVPIKYRVYRDLIEPPPDGRMREWTLGPLPERFAELCRVDGLACLDLTGPLREAVRSGGRPYAAVDSHWSPEGHQLVARLLAEMLESLEQSDGARR